MSARDLCLLCYLLFQSISGGQISDVRRAIDHIDSQTPAEIRFTIGADGLPKGGHLQGVQWFQRNGFEFLMLSGSSDAFSYFLTVPLSGADNKLATLTQLLPSPYRHAGGFQVVGGRFAAVGLEDNQTKNISKVWIVDMTAEQAFKRPMPLIEIERRGEVERATAGAIAMAGKYLIVGTWDSATLDFYESNGLSLDDKQCRFEKRDIWSAADADRSDWSDPGYGSYQNFNLIGDAKGNYFLVGFCRDEDIDRLDLFEVRSENATPLSRRLVKRASKRFHCIKTTFQAGAGLRILKDGSLKVYACSHLDGVVEVFD